MRRLIAVSVLACLALIGLSRPAQAQDTLTLTTLTNAASATTGNLVVGSTSGVSAGYIGYVDREAVLVISVQSATQMTVQRGYNGTSSAAHLASAPFYLDQSNYFYASDVSGSCTSTNQVVLPRVNVISGQIATCVNGRWQGQNGGYTPFTNAVLPRTPVANAAYTVLYTDVIVAYTSLSAGRSVTLPSASAMAGKIIIVKDEVGLANTYNITVVGTIDGASNATINTNYGVGRYVSSGAAWFTW